MAKEWEIEFSDEVKASIERDPALAEAMREVASRLRQATADFEAGRYKSIDDAMEAIGAERFE